jgi:hypothetical protein
MTPMNLTDDSSTADSANTVNTTIAAWDGCQASEIRGGSNGGPGRSLAMYRREHAMAAAVCVS